MNPEFSSWSRKRWVPGVRSKTAAEFPEFLLEVRERLRKCEGLEAQIEAMFPPSSEGMAARPRHLIPGDSPPEIPGYQVEAVLGRGGAGVVYHAKHLKLNRYVALKMLHSGTYADPHDPTLKNLEPHGPPAELLVRAAGRIPERLQPRGAGRVAGRRGLLRARRVPPFAGERRH